MKKQKTNKVKTVVYLIHFILIDIWARNGVLHIFSPAHGGLWRRVTFHRSSRKAGVNCARRRSHAEKHREYGENEGMK